METYKRRHKFPLCLAFHFHLLRLPGPSPTLAVICLRVSRSTSKHYRAAGSHRIGFATARISQERPVGLARGLVFALLMDPPRSHNAHHPISNLFLTTL